MPNFGPKYCYTLTLESVSYWKALVIVTRPPIFGAQMTMELSRWALFRMLYWSFRDVKGSYADVTRGRMTIGVSFAILQIDRC